MHIQYRLAPEKINDPSQKVGQPFAKKEPQRQAGTNPPGTLPFAVLLSARI